MREKEPGSSRLFYWLMGLPGKRPDTGKRSRVVVSPSFERGSHCAHIPFRLVKYPLCPHTMRPPVATIRHRHMNAHGSWSQSSTFLIAATAS